MLVKLIKLLATQVSTQGDTNLSDTITNFENIDLSTATNAVLITGDTGSNTLTGGAGSDNITGRSRNQTLQYFLVQSLSTHSKIGKTLIVSDSQAGRDGSDTLSSS